MSFKTLLGSTRIIPVIVIEDPASAVPLVSALARGGLPVVEITLRTAAALDAIRQIKAGCPDAIIGAGTILREDQLRAAREAGATFGVSPGLDCDILSLSKSLAFPFVPGIATASELTLALKHGCDVVKFFPAENAGGVKMIQALCGAFRHTGVTFMPTGGVTQANIASYLAVKEVAAAGSSWIAEGSLIKAGNWEEIERRAREACAAIAAL